MNSTTKALIDALDRYMRQDETAGDTDNGVYRQGQQAMAGALSQRTEQQAGAAEVAREQEADTQPCETCGRHPEWMEREAARWPEASATGAEPVGWRELLRQSEENFNRQFGISVAAAWVYRDLEELLGASDVCQGCNGAGGTYTGGPCPECYGQGTYEGAREFVSAQQRIGTVEVVDGRVRSFAFEQTDIPTGSYSLYPKAVPVHDKRCPAALNLSDPCNCGETS